MSINNTNLRINGINPLSYMGVNPYVPVPFFLKNRAPTVNDSQNFQLGTLWLYVNTLVVPNTYEVYLLASLSGGTASWIKLYVQGGGGGGVSQFTTDDSAIVTPLAGNVNILGDGVITTTGAIPNTVSIGLSAGADGQLIIGGSTGAAWADLTSTDGSITITPGINALSIETNTTWLGNNGAPGAHQAAGILNIVGVDPINTVVTTAAGNTITIGVWDTFRTDDTNTAKPALGEIVVAGANGVSTSSVGNTITIHGGGGGGISAQPFFAYLGTAVIGATGDSVGSPQYFLGTKAALTIVYDLSGGFYGGDSVNAPATFTAPASGIYSFTFHIGMGNSQSPGAFKVTQPVKFIVTPNRTYNLSLKSADSINPYMSPNLSAGTDIYGQTLQTIADMTIGDVATFGFQVFTPGTTMGLFAGTASVPITYISGYRIA